MRETSNDEAERWAFWDRREAERRACCYGILLILEDGGFFFFFLNNGSWLIIMIRYQYAKGTKFS